MSDELTPAGESLNPVVESLGRWAARCVKGSAACSMPTIRRICGSCRSPHRFSFQTVGFVDGRTHVVSAAHPGGELRGLLVHEYTHALFKLLAGDDQPYWLNEGLA